jgi:hypothetical protein
LIIYWGKKRGGDMREDSIVVVQLRDHQYWGLDYNSKVSSGKVLGVGICFKGRSGRQTFIDGLDVHN